jgi:uncharacterized protein (DUF4213/DUF364 family)
MILDDLLAALTTDAPVREIRVGAHWVAVCSRHCGLASTLGQAGGSDAAGFAGRSARELAELARSDTLPEASLGMAAVNSLLEVDESLSVDLNARDLLIERGRGKRVALVGHFPFVPKLREAAGQLWVLELLPRPGDLPASEAERVIPQADVVAISGTTFLNHTIDTLLSYRRPGALVVVLGPTTPLSPVLFAHGVDVISGARVVAPEVALPHVSEGKSFSGMPGVRLLTMQRPDGTK